MGRRWGGLGSDGVYAGDESQGLATVPLCPVPAPMAWGVTPGQTVSVCQFPHVQSEDPTSDVWLLGLALKEPGEGRLPCSCLPEGTRTHLTPVQGNSFWL